MTTQVQTITDAQGNVTGVIVLIELWREIEADKETVYLLRGETMRSRLLEAKERSESVSLEEVHANLGI